MRYGGAVALIVIGAILYFAVRIEFQPVGLTGVDDGDATPSGSSST